MGSGEGAGTTATPGEPESVARRRRSAPLDAAVVPCCLLWIARDLAWHDPVRVLGWRLLHEALPGPAPRWLQLALPRPSEGLDRDPVALLLASAAAALAALYLGLALSGASARLRAVVVTAAMALLVALPTAAFVALGVATERPYGQDGGVVQLPLAVDRILAGTSPYGADYSDSILGKQSRVSSFWEPYGGNPILHHHAYLPGTHAIVAPFQVACRRVLGFFDPRIVTWLAFVAAGILAAVSFPGPDRRLAALAVVWLNPLVYWHQVFGANDVLFVLVLLLAGRAADAGRPGRTGALVGFACAVKQLAWPFAPFLLIAVSGARGWRELARPPSRRRLGVAVASAAAVFAAVVLPVALMDVQAFWGDIVLYNAGLGGDAYPFGGTPGFGLANLLLYAGVVTDLRAGFPFGPLYVLLVPVGVLLVRAQLRGGPGMVWLTGGTALLTALYLSRVVHPNYLLAAAILVPLGLLAGARPPDAGLVPLLLLGLGAEVAEVGPLRTAWDQAVAVDLPAHLHGLVGWLAPRAAPAVTDDPLGLAWSAVAAGLAVVYLVAAVSGVSARWRTALVVSAAVATVAVPLWIVTALGARTGVARAQRDWVVRVPAAAASLASGTSPYAPSARTFRAREAWSTSFRREPPRVLEPEPPLALPGAAWLLLPMGTLDPRWLSLAGLALAAALAAARASAQARPLVLGGALLAPPLALGVVFGGPEGLLVGGLTVAAVALGLGRDRVVVVVTGLALATDARAWLLAPALLAPVVARHGWRSLRLGALAALAGLAPPILLDPAGALRTWLASPAVPGIGLDGLLAYAGSETAVPCGLGWALALGVGVWLAWRWSPTVGPFGVAALVSATALVLSCGASADAVAVPLVFALMAATLAGTSGESPRPD